MKKILAIDDSSINLRILKDSLSDEYILIPVLSGKMALKYLETQPADLILIDMYMPDMDGIETLRCIRSMDECRDIPIIFLSASVEEQVKRDCFILGAKDYIQKPFKASFVKETIKRILSEGK